MQLTRTALELDGQPVTMGDIFAAAALRGALDPLRQGIRSRLVAAGAASQRGVKINPATLQAELDHWRTEHDLIAAEEAEAWLSAYDLDLDELLAFLERRFLAQLAGQPVHEAYVHDDDVAAVLEYDIIFDDQFKSLAADFALRGVVDPVDDQTVLKAECGALLNDLGMGDTSEASAAVGDFEVPLQRVGELLNMEASFRIRRRELTNEATLARALDDYRQELVLLQFQTVRLFNEDIAREVMCCVRDDGDSLSAAAARAAAVVSDETCFAKDLDDSPLARCIRSGAAGEMFGPTSVNDGMIVGQLLDRIEPDPANAAVRRRLESLVLDRTLQPGVAERVRFIRT